MDIFIVEWRNLKMPTDAGFAAGYPGTSQNICASDQ